MGGAGGGAAAEAGARRLGRRRASMLAMRRAFRSTRLIDAPDDQPPRRAEPSALTTLSMSPPAGPQIACRCTKAEPSPPARVRFGKSEFWVRYIPREFHVGAQPTIAPG